jgi:proline iminopeptidase
MRRQRGRGAVSRRLAATAALTAVVGACDPASRDTAARERLLPINGTQIYVKRLGTGEPILVVHGGPVLEHGYLLPHLAPLADHYELIFYDQRLSGRSDPSVDSASVRLGTFVDDIEALRQALRLDAIHLLAHSWGGLLAVHYALRHQEHLTSLILLNSMSPSSDLWQEEERVLAGRISRADSLERAAIQESQAFAARDPEAIRRLLLLSFKTQFSDTTRIDELDLYVPTDYADRSRQFGYMMVDLTSFDLRDRLADIDVPTLILYGSDEPGADLGGVALRDGIPNARFEIVDSAGHFPFIERQEASLSAVEQFMRTLPPQ